MMVLGIRSNHETFRGTLGVPSLNNKVAACAHVVRSGERGTVAAPATSEALADVRKPTKQLWRRKKPMPRTFALACFLCLFACAEPSSTRVATVTDSAGVTIVSSPAEIIGALAAWNLGETPVLDIRTQDGEGPALFRVSIAVALSEGRTAVGNGGSMEVLIFDTQGELIQVIGGEGQGPGEFGSIKSILELSEDSIGVYDPSLRRFSVFGTDGNLVRSFETRDLNPPGGSSKILQLPNRELILFGEGGIGSELGVHRLSAESFRLSGVGEVLGSMGSFPGSESYVSETGSRGKVFFGAGTFSVTLGDLLAVGLADVPEFRLYGQSGELARVVRWISGGRPVTEEDVARHIDVAASAVPEAQREMVRDVLSSVPHAEATPIYDDLIASDEGDLWVGLYEAPVLTEGVARYARRTWLVFDREGAPRATLETPEGFRLHAVRDGRALGVQMDELGVEYVRAYAIGK